MKPHHYSLLFGTLLGCQPALFTTGQEADIVLGELGFNTSGGPLLFNHPKGIATDGTTFMMADGNNNRVLVWSELPTGNVEPDWVLGQPDFDSNDSGESDNSMKWPADVAVGGGKYVVADTYNHRILIWDSLPQSNGSEPDLILTSAEHPDTFDVMPGVDRFAWPWGVWTDGERLIVTSTSSGSANGDIRFGGWVLIWNEFPTIADQPADIVLSADREMGTPRSITTDGNSFLIIGDHNAQGQTSQSGNWLWNTFPTMSEQPPSGFMVEDEAVGWQAGDVNSAGDLMMIGNGIHVWNGIPETADIPPEFTIDGDDWELRGGDGSTIAVADERVYVSDYNTNRILGFNTAPENVNAVPDFVIGAPDVQSNTLRDNYFISNGIPLSLDTGEFLIGDGLNTQVLCWTAPPAKSGQAPDSTLDFRDETVALAKHKETIVIAGKREGIHIWQTQSPCTDKQSDIHFSRSIGSVSLDNLQSVTLDQHFFYVLDQPGTLHVWDGIPAPNQNPDFSIPLNTVNGILYSDGEHLSVSGMDTFRFAEVRKFSDNTELQQFQYSERPQMTGHGIIKDGQVFISDLSQHRILTWGSFDNALSGAKPDAILGATSLEDTDPDKTRTGLFWPLRLDFDGERLWVGEYKFSGRVLSYIPE